MYTNLTPFVHPAFGNSFLSGERFTVLGQSSEQVTLEHAKTGQRVRVSQTFFQLRMAEVQS